jgi:hypothetical protein
MTDDPILTMLTVGGGELSPARRSLLAARAAGCNCNPDGRPMTRVEIRAAGYDPDDGRDHWRVEHDNGCALLQRAQGRRGSN